MTILTFFKNVYNMYTENKIGFGLLSWTVEILRF